MTRVERRVIDADDRGQSAKLRFAAKRMRFLLRPAHAWVLSSVGESCLLGRGSCHRWGPLGPCSNTPFGELRRTQDPTRDATRALGVLDSAFMGMAAAAYAFSILLRTGIRAAPWVVSILLCRGMATAPMPEIVERLKLEMIDKKFRDAP